MSNQSIIEHKANMFYVEFREDYLAICLQCTYKKPVKGKEKSKASPYCKAIILAISESWTNEKRGKGTDLSFYMTYPQWIESMYGMFGRNVVIDSVDELIGEKLLSREPIKYKGKDTFRYTLNHAEINRRMKALPDCAPYNTRPQINALISKRDDKSTGLQVNGKAFTNQPDTRLQVNDDPFTKGRNIESTNHLDIDSAQNTEEGTSRDHADTGSLHSPTPAHSPIATDTPTTEDEHGYTHPDMAFHGSALPARGSAHSHLAPAANSTAREVAHGQPDATFAQQDSTPPAQTSQQPTTSERVAPSAAMPDSGYEKDDEETQKRPAVGVPAQQLSTFAGSSAHQSAKVEPKAEQDALIARPDKPEMPLPSARWCAETAVLVSEALRGKYYTEGQRQNQVSAAKRMFRDFTISRAQFEEIFTDWVAWWRDHDKGIFTLAGLLARGQDREVRLQTSLDRLEARASVKKLAKSMTPPSNFDAEVEASRAAMREFAAREKARANV